MQSPSTVGLVCAPSPGGECKDGRRVLHQGDFFECPDLVLGDANEHYVTSCPWLCMFVHRPQLSVLKLQSSWLLMLQPPLHTGEREALLLASQHF